jgi:DNA-binding NarL/FixJ family response regulator
MNVTLSERELSVIRLVAEGKTNEEVGKDLCISPNTVRAHLVRIGLKLRVHKRADIVYMAAKKRMLNGSRDVR